MVSSCSRTVTARLAIAEGWHRGPTIGQIADPAAVGPVLADLVARARKNAGINGADLD